LHHASSVDAPVVLFAGRILNAVTSIGITGGLARIRVASNICAQTSGNFSVGAILGGCVNNFAEINGTGVTIRTSSVLMNATNSRHAGISGTRISIITRNGCHISLNTPSARIAFSDNTLVVKNFLTIEFLINAATAKHTIGARFHSAWVAIITFSGTGTSFSTATTESFAARSTLIARREHTGCGSDTFHQIQQIRKVAGIKLVNGGISCQFVQGAFSNTVANANSNDGSAIVRRIHQRIVQHFTGHYTHTV
jgi:hypothetical protein